METLLVTQKSVSSLISDFEKGNIAVPEIQRDVVWKSDQVKQLVDSIDRGYPCGSLILWRPRERDEKLIRTIVRPERLELFDHRLPEFFLLDGQQRLTALASIFLDRSKLKKMLVEMEDEMPLLFGNLKRTPFPRDIEASTETAGYKFPWVLLNRVFDGSVRQDDSYDSLDVRQRQSVEEFIQRMRDYQFPVQIISHRDYATVAEIFARVNSQGTQLTGAEIHLAKIVPYWSGITREFRSYREELRQKSYDLDLTFLMRAITVIECRVAQINKLADRVANPDPAKRLKKRHLMKVWRQAKSATDAVVNVLRRDLDLDKSKFFTSKNVLIPLVYCVAQQGRSKLNRNILRFFLASQLSEHYGSAGETVLRRDMRTLADPATTPQRGLEELADNVIREAKQYYRGMKIKADDVSGPSSKNVMLLLMYILMRRRGATDFGTVSPQSLGDIEPSDIQLHHIFPFNFMMTDKAALKMRDDRGYKPPEYREIVNDIANLTFISQAKNAAIGDLSPWTYLANETSKEMRKQHFIPEDRTLWQPEHLEDFVAERRQLIAAGLNSLLRSLI